MKVSSEVIKAELIWGKNTAGHAKVEVNLFNMGLVLFGEVMCQQWRIEKQRETSTHLGDWSSYKKTKIVDCGDYCLCLKELRESLGSEIMWT